ncbi:hypothetical protein ACM66B_006504 [Microbotryomycetes sp. NB124-2]
MRDNRGLILTSRARRPIGVDKVSKLLNAIANPEVLILQFEKTKAFGLQETVLLNRSFPNLKHLTLYGCMLVMTDAFRMPRSGIDTLVLYWVLPLLMPNRGGVVLDNSETALSMERSYHELLSNVNETCVTTWNDSMFIMLEWGTRLEVQSSRPVTDRRTSTALSPTSGVGRNLSFQPWKFRKWIVRADPHQSFSRPLQPLDNVATGERVQGLVTFLPHLETVHVRGDLASPSISSTEVGVREFVGNLVTNTEQASRYLPKLRTVEFAVNPGCPPHVRNWSFTDTTRRIINILDQPLFSHVNKIKVSWLNVMDNFEELSQDLMTRRGIRVERLTDYDVSRAAAEMLTCVEYRPVVRFAV